MNLAGIQEIIYQTIDSITKKRIDETPYLFIIEGEITEVESLGNGYFFMYQGERYIGFSITGENYQIGDLVYVLFSNNKNIKKMILSNTKDFSNNDIRRALDDSINAIIKIKDTNKEIQDNLKTALNRVDVLYYVSTSSETLENGKWITVLPPRQDLDKKFIWTKTVTTYADGHVLETSPICMTGVDGVGIDYLKEMYYKSISNVELLGGTWTDIAPTWEEGKYIWTKTIIHYSNNIEKETEPVCYTGSHGKSAYESWLEEGHKGTQADFVQSLQGKDGKNGINGAPGTSQYFHIKYAPNSSPTESEMTEIPDLYIGTYVDEKKEDSNKPSDYTWSKFQGLDGENGLPGKNGTNGQTSYLHIKYSNDNGATFTSNNGEDSGAYLGQYVDFEKIDSDTPSDYKWSLIQGEDGASLESIDVLYKESTSNTTPPNNDNWTTKAPQWREGYYIWTRTKTTVLLPNKKDKNITYSKPVCITGMPGPKGETGVGIKSVTITYGSSLSSQVQPTQWFNTVGEVKIKEGEYLWTRTITDYTNDAAQDSVVYNYVKQGETGAAGTSVSIKEILYQEGDSSTTPPEGNWNKNIVEVHQGKYLWTKIIFSDDTSIYTIARQGADGRTPQKGVDYFDGANGTNNFIHVRYSEKENGLNFVTAPTSKTKYIGIATTTNSTAPTLSQDYKWSKYVGENGVDGGKGADGKSSYIHIAYSNSSDGEIDFSLTSADGRSYIGTYKDETEKDSSIPSKYKWSLIKGADGKDGQGISSVTITYGVSSTNTDKPVTWSPNVPTSIKEGDYLWTRTITDYTSAELQDSITYTYTKQGAKGRSIKKMSQKFYLSSSYSELKNGQWLDTIPNNLNDKFLWIKTVIEYENPNGVQETDPVCSTGKPGKDGYTPKKGVDYFDGVAGPKGESSYIHIRYSINSDGSNFVTSPSVSTKYIGVATTNSQTGPTDKTGYKWSKYIGENGTRGPKGEDGQSNFIHIAYANSSDGSLDFSTTIATNKSYIGTYTDKIEKDSEDYHSYNWSLTRGEDGYTPKKGVDYFDGAKGDQGIPGKNGLQLYTWLKYADSPTTGMSDTPDNKRYIGLAYNKTTAIESTSYNDYQWSLIKGKDGEKGIQGEKGKDGIQLYTWVKYADSPTSGMSDAPEGKEYIGLAYNKTSSQESTNYKDYQWSLIKGNDGANGIPGKNGEDGKTPYLHIAYSNSADGSKDFSTTDSVGKTYLGQFTDFTSTDSTNYKDYTWSLIKGQDGINGLNGKDGLPGKNGSSSYTHIAYSNSQDGSRDFSTTDSNRKYIGMYIDNIKADSENYKSYKWTLIKGDNGISSYLHIRYSQSADGTNFVKDPTEKTKYIGVTYTTSTIAPVEKENYSWSKYVGENGIQGPKGTDGESSYIHIAYSNSQDGQQDFSKTDATNRKYIGTYKDKVEIDSDDPSKYNWALSRGADGYTPRKGVDYFDGKNGTNGINGTSSYLHIRYSSKSDGEGFVNAPTFSTKYIGVATTSSTTAPAQKTGYKWSKYIGENGTPGAAGKNGESSYVHIAYANSQDGKNNFSTTDATGRSYIGTYTDKIEKDSETPSKYTWSLIQGADGSSITITSIVYQAGTSNTVPPEGNWSASPVTVPAGHYLWTKTTFSDGKTSYGVARQGIDGKPGAQGQNGKDGVSINSTSISFGKSLSNTSKPTTWYNTIEEVRANPGEYLWTRTIIDYTDPLRQDSITYTYARQGEKGESGTSITVTSITYQQGDSATVAPQGSWSSSPVEVAEGKYLWTKTTFSDGKIAYAVVKQGSKGISGTFTAKNKYNASSCLDYSSRNGTVSWSDSEIKEPKGDAWQPGNIIILIIECTDGDTYLSYQEVMSMNSLKPRSYWISKKGINGSDGAPGQGITSIVEQYALSNSKVEIPSAEKWSETPPNGQWKPGLYVWTRSKITYENPVKIEYTTPMCSSEWEAIDNIEVGGRNLILKSNTPVSNANYLLCDYNLSTNTLKDGENVTFQIKGSLGAGKEAFLIYNSGGSYSIDTTHNGTFNNGIYTVTTKWAGAAWSSNNYISIYTYPSSSYAESSIEWIKLERGNKATDWTPAPEDIQQGIDGAQQDADNANNKTEQNQQLIVDLDKDLTVMADQLKLIVSKKDENGEYVSAMTQTGDKITFDITSLESTVDAASKQSASNSEHIDEIIQETTKLDNSLKDIAKKTSYIEIGQDTQGRPTLTLGSSESNFKVVQTNESLDFYDGTQKVAYVQHDRLYISNAEVTDTLRIGEGDGLVWKKRANGNVGLRRESATSASVFFKKEGDIK